MDLKITRPDDSRSATESGENDSSIKNPTKSIKTTSDKRNKKKKSHTLRNLFIFFALLLICIASGVWYYYPSTVSSKQETPKVILNETPISGPDYKFEGTSLLLSYSFVKENLDSSLYWEPETNKIVVTTADKVIEMNTDQLTAFVNSKPVTIDIPVRLYDSKPFVPLDFLSSIYGIKIEKLESGITIIDDLKKPVLSMIVKESSILDGVAFLQNVSFLDETPFMRESPSFRSPRIKELKPGDIVIVVGEESNWYKVRSSNGFLGFIKKAQAVLKEIIPIRQEEIKSKTPWSPLGGKINLTWDYMSKPINDMGKYVKIPGLNVISPTWFSLEDSEGTIKNSGSIPYMTWAKKEGLQIWPLFSNNFDPKITTPVLRSFDLRKKVIQQLLIFAETYDFEGINIDFENVEYADKDFLTQFIRELTPYMHEQDLTVSIDVTIRSTNPSMSMVFDRPALAKIVDYMAVMTYDEHWSTSPESGSVASLPWVKDGLTRILEQIPKEKLLLGVPFYTRVWEETKQADGTIKVTSKALSMSSVVTLLKEKNVQPSLDSTTGQNFGTYTEGNKTFKVWIEDEYSMRQRISLVKEYGLAGVASWRKGFEEPAIWDVIKDELSKMP